MPEAPGSGPAQGRTPLAVTRPALSVNGPLVAVGLVLALATFALGIVLARDLFMTTEVRYWLREPLSGDVQRYFLTPVLAWGDTRWTAMILFNVVGQACSPDAGCVNGVAAGLVALAVVLLVGHTYQLLHSIALTIPVAVLWVISAPVLNIWMWQSTWSDLAAFLSLMVVASFWWWAFGRPGTSRVGALLFVVASLLLMAVAFNAKELLWILVGIMPIVAVVRSRPGTLRRNLLLCIVPLAWATWYIVYALLHLSPDYAAQVGSRSMADGVLYLLRQTLGIDIHFMSLSPTGSLPGTLREAAVALYLLFAVGVLVTFLVAVRRARTPWRSPGSGLPAAILASVRAWSAEVYLVALAGATLLVAARSNGASAYYMLIPWWAGLTLTVALLRRWRALPLLGLLAAGVLASYLLLLQPAAVAPSLLDASRRLTETGTAIGVLLRDRDVTRVTWRAEGPPWADFYLLRDNRKAPPGWSAGPDLWPWLIRTTAPVAVEDLRTGSAGEILGDLDAHSAPGEVVVVVGSDYRLELLAHEGEVLYQAPGVTRDGLP